MSLFLEYSQPLHKDEEIVFPPGFEWKKDPADKSDAPDGELLLYGYVISHADSVNDSCHIAHWLKEKLEELWASPHDTKEIGQ
ncbi:unnamed protein product, partial [marine sediment metagenome]